MTNSNLGSFLVQKPRPLPILVAVDRSGSMSEDGKIDALNLSLRNFINSIRDEDGERAELQISIISFGGNQAVIDVPLTPVSEITEIKEYVASGRTPMGSAFVAIKEMIEDRDKISSRSYKPTIVLFTDGIPTDDYAKAMNDLIKEGRSSKAIRIAMAMGDDADVDMLSGFVSSKDYLVKGENAKDIVRFFKFVTMSVQSRTKSQTPDNPPVPNIEEIDF
jgi:uncharacterized protein YegL